MNKLQRNNNRANAAKLRLMGHTCENCGEQGGHWVQTQPQSIADVLEGIPDQGFWTCQKYHGEEGRRLTEN